jgi:signal transduction histidine kinase
MCAPHQITIRLFADDKIATIEVEDTGPGMDAGTREAAPGSSWRFR